ncbi:LPS-assembly protein LptD [Pseudidiomarina insulisalsae]|uniref:LPS-assembly protein LptD n=1 Tax=Pseudidiomarina insulisalsae TaxID=575789 RepID=A0A432YA27_9GAMM|nr:LPS assembly protein LptD [Pseudidiomarina insulisalsae]RUO57828.1 LPS-assembly protein LptD [Pseudidiomarina insulisalsae]
MHYITNGACLGISLALLASFSGTAHAQDNTEFLQQCPVRAPLFTMAALDPIENLAAGAIGVRADAANIDSATSIASFTGNVQVQLDKQFLLTEQATVNQDSGNINASGATSFTDGYVQVASENFRLNSGENRAYLAGASYQLQDTGAHGTAELLSIAPEQVLLAGSTFTTCPTEQPAWQLSADEIIINEDEAWGEAWHAKFELFGVPVLYVPYMNFPITDERKSGFLFPTVRSSQKNGFEFEIPYYINIAPNQDATLTPRYMAERGLQLQGEYRILTDSGSGQANVAYLNEDDSLESDDARYLWRVEHQQNWSPNWRSYINALDISDDDYLNDFGSDFAGRADAQLYRHARVDYYSEHARVMLRAEDFEILGDYRPPYRTAPQLASWLNWQDNQPLGLSLFSEFTQFRNQEDSNDQATRFHIEPTLQYTLEQPSYDVLSELRYSYTYYDQTLRTSTDPMQPVSELSENPSRSLPQFRLRGRVNLERNFAWQGQNYQQILQPQIQYLYVPYRDQSDIGIYDSTLMQDDYQGLFRARRFSGLDRIADANQVTVGASTSVFSENARELLRFSAGQIYYFDESQVSLFDGASQIADDRSDLAFDTRFRFGERWFFNGAMQYDMEQNNTRKSQTAIEYRVDERNLIQFSHRQVTNILDDDIEQLGLQAVYQVQANWQIASNWYYDLEQKRTNDALLALQYNDCCWAIRVSAYRRINRNLESLNTDPMNRDPEFDNGISVQFIIKGLGSDNGNLFDLIEQSLFGYRHPFYLSN